MNIIGVDEVGRGSIAGPVITCAVLLPKGRRIPGLTDSKELSARQREALAPQIFTCALAIGYGRADVTEIDRANILHATMRAMERAVASISDKDASVLVDGNCVPEGLRDRAKAIIRGDKSIVAISAASVLAKLARDNEMAGLAVVYPGYGFEKNAGYPTRAHCEALRNLGVTPVHRRSFSPVRKLLEVK